MVRPSSYFCDFSRKDWCFGGSERVHNDGDSLQHRRVCCFFFLIQLFNSCRSINKELSSSLNHRKLLKFHSEIMQNHISTILKHPLLRNYNKIFGFPSSLSLL